ncbi:LAMP family protein lmp-1-like [Sycon ciliatum]|uniref:LAMP family protein lmp-1-like n=1 Tax=Sycon ciliatum TaxID=27933 RepID=UPI0031F6A331
MQDDFHKKIIPPFPQNCSAGRFGVSLFRLELLLGDFLPRICTMFVAKWLPVVVLVSGLAPLATGETDEYDAVAMEVVGEDEEYGQHTYVVENDNGVPCMSVALEASFEVPYVSSAQGAPTTLVSYFPLPGLNTSAKISNDSVCPENATAGEPGRLVVLFGTNYSQIFTINVDVHMDGKNTNWSVANFSLMVDYTDEKYFNTSAEPSQDEAFTAEVDISSDSTNGYECADNETVVLSSETSTSNVTLLYKDLVIDPFNNGKLTSCDAPAPGKAANRIVPIAVGAALAGLLLLVLVAYAINRRTSKRGGYEKV